MVQTKEGTFASVAHDGATIHTKAWLPDESAPPVAVVVWSHGVHEHLGRFERLYERFVRARIATYAWDHVGHGKSGFSGGKSHQFAAGFDAVVADAVQFAKCAFPSPSRTPRGESTLPRVVTSSLPARRLTDRPRPPSSRRRSVPREISLHGPRIPRRRVFRRPRRRARVVATPDARWAWWSSPRPR